RTPAGSTALALDGYGLRGQSPARQARVASYPVSVRQVAVLLRTAFRPHLTVTPLCFASLHLHQVGQGTFTPKLSNMLGTRLNRSRGRALRASCRLERPARQ